MPNIIDNEDFLNCKLDLELKKMINNMKINIPIVHIIDNKYFLGI